MTKYIWHTKEDDKVRPWHADRDGEIFDTDDPPEDGNPGEAENCRCWAEPIEEEDENKGKTYLLFDGQKLMWYENGQKVKEWPAMSGKENFQSSKYTSIPNAGPIPEGKWHVRQENHQSADFIDQALGFVGMGKWRGGYSSWGDDRIWLEPDKKTDTQGRTNLSIHGRLRSRLQGVY